MVDVVVVDVPIVHVKEDVEDVVEVDVADLLEW